MLRCNGRQVVVRPAILEQYRAAHVDGEGIDVESDA
jgi:hypothetical protein